MSVTAKVKCNAKNAFQGASTTLSFGPDYADGRNKEWANATPSLSLSMTVNGQVADYFTLGESYTLTFDKE